MLSLRSFHVVFILIAIVGADMVGAWAIWHYGVTREPWLPWLAAVVLLGGLGLAGYAIWFVRKLDRAHIT